MTAKIWRRVDDLEARLHAVTAERDALVEALRFAYSYVGRLAIEEDAGNVLTSVLPASLALKKIEGVLVGVGQKVPA